MEELDESGYIHDLCIDAILKDYGDKVLSALKMNGLHLGLESANVRIKEKTGIVVYSVTVHKVSPKDLFPESMFEEYKFKNNRRKR